ncbi:MAG TPA: phosphatidylglycerophosphatase A [Ignavibacteriaceae bacterium]|jgi:phosphatidylglycerophosphatase A
MKLNQLEKFFGSGIYTGYSPVASGTAGSLLALLIYWIPGFEELYIIIPVTLLTLIFGIFVGTKFEYVYGKDPAECTIDEVVGTWVSLILLPKTLGISLTAFIIWRILDIIKPHPARNVEKLNGGVGIMLDDVISGLYTFLIMHLLVYLTGIF